MSSLYVTDITVPTLLERLKKGEWQVPEFQRDFVWSVADVIKLISSIIESRPIGMATLWEQGPAHEVSMGPISIADKNGPRCLGEAAPNLSKVFALLDGRQRCTAIAMAFGGLRAQDGKFKFSGRFYLDVATSDPSKRVRYYRETEVVKKGLKSDAGCIGQGLFPLSSSMNGEELLGQWMRYLQALKDPSNYENAKLPDPTELVRRDEILKKCFEGLVGTKLAVYVVPETYHLADICDIFETLNTTGTKVSTVDLIHSLLYADTKSSHGSPILLRDWINELGQKDGAIGWSSSEDRPELVAQIVTACYVALETKQPPRSVAGLKSETITSVKSADLLAVPKEHWRNVISNDDLLANYLGDFQKLVAGGYFPYSECPYPVSAAVYVGLRWHLHFDQPSTWARTDLDSVYRAFFWRNALTSRYDQGFLTQIDKDMKFLKQVLRGRESFESAVEWANSSQKKLTEYMAQGGTLFPANDQLFDWLTQGRQTGALQKALTLPMVAGTHQDLIDPEIRIGFPGGEQVELHHIFPKAWCNNSKAGELAALFSERDWVDSTANLMPLSRKSNNVWKAKIPGQIFQEKQVQYETIQAVAKQVFIDADAFTYLLNGPTQIKEFWTMRAKLIADDLMSRAGLKL
ncbi:MAG: DUF262 domain-containing protein [Chthonomonadales bacterium]